MAIVRIRDIGISHRDASLLHLRNKGERYGRFHAIEAWEADMAGRILDHVAVEIGHRAAWLDHRIYILGAKKAAESRVAAWFVGQ